jgi:hypothetical protein
MRSKHNKESEPMTEELLIKRDIALKKATTILVILCCMDMAITYFALTKQMHKYPDSWREKELSFTVGPLLRTFRLNIIPALAIGAVINSILYISVLKKIRTEFVYGVISGAIILAIMSNARIAWMM